MPCRFIKWQTPSAPPVDLGIPGTTHCPPWPSFRAAIWISNSGRIALHASGSSAYTLMDTTLTQLPVPANAADVKLGGINSCGDIVGTLVYSRHVGGAVVIRWRRLEGGFPACDQARS